MPSSYDSYHSPSLHKMNGNLEANAGRGGLRRFSFGNTLVQRIIERSLKASRTYCWRPVRTCDYIDSIGTFAPMPSTDTKNAVKTDKYLRQLAWLITFIASIISAVRTSFPNFAWWAIAYLFCVIVGVFVVVGSDATHIYRVAVRILFSPDARIPLMMDRLLDS